MVLAHPATTDDARALDLSAQSRAFRALAPEALLMSKTPFDLKRLKLTDAAQAWIEWRAKASGKTPQEVVRDELHAMALKQIHEATLLSGIAATRGIRGDGGGQTS
jgi:hypothetical protein